MGLNLGSSSFNNLDDGVGGDEVPMTAMEIRRSRGAEGNVLY